MMNGKIFSVGIGPGNENEITPKAIDALNKSDIIIGYKVYIDFIKQIFPNKEMISFDMRQEVDRAMLTISKAKEGKSVSIISSGDSGVYGMAPLLYECMAREDIDDIEVEVISGITAAQSCAAILGSPLSNDYAVVSLSDIITKWSDIEKRLNGAFSGGFPVVIYNPMSSKRREHLKNACQIALKYLSGDTACGYVRNASRSDESYKILALSELKNSELDMFTTVIIGNSETKVIKGKLVTMRNYLG